MMQSDAMRSGERAVQKARRGFRPGFDNFLRLRFLA